MGSSTIVEPLLSGAIGASRGAKAKSGVLRAAFWVLPILFYFGLFLWQPPAIHDEGLILCGAERILHGQLPYRDFDTGYTPAQFYTVAGVWRIFGTSLVAARLWDALWRLAILAVFVLLSRAMLDAPVHALPIACAVVFAGVVGFHLYPMIAAMLPCLAAVWCAVRYLKGGATVWLFTAGLLAGVGILYRHDLGACICFAVVAGLGLRIRPIAIFAAGVLLVALPAFAALWIAIPHAALQHAFLDFPKLNMAARRVPLPGPGSLPAWEVLYLPMGIMLTAAGIWIRRARAQRRIVTTLLAAAASTLALAMQRLDVPHAYPAILFSLVLLGVSFEGLRRQSLPAAFLKAGAVVCYIALPLFVCISEAADPYKVPGPAPAIARAGIVSMASDQRQAVAYIDAHLPPDRPLYVGLDRHSRQFYNDTLFYFLAGRRQATRFDMFVPGVTNAASVQTEIARGLTEQRVAYVVLFHAPVSSEPNLSSVDNGVTILDDAILRDYQTVAEFGRYTIRRRAAD